MRKVLFTLLAEDVVVLESMAGTKSEYSVAELLRVELMGDSIRFIASDGSVAAEVYKYDYVKMTIADKPEAIEITNQKSKITNAVKIILDGQLFIQHGDELFNAQGARVE